MMEYWNVGFVTHLVEKYHDSWRKHWKLIPKI